MKIKRFFVHLIVVFIALSFFPTLIYGQSSGHLRIMKERGETVINRKNLFIEKVLNSYTIPYKKNKEGVVFMIEVEGNWYELERIEIIPSVDIHGIPIKGGGHEIYFLTRDGQGLVLFSDKEVR
jgi:hypothetical protein